MPNFTIANHYYIIILIVLDMNSLYIIPLFLGNIRGWQLVIILVIILLLFGGKKIPELMRGLGKGVQQFKKGMAEAREELDKVDLDDNDKKDKSTPEKK